MNTSLLSEARGAAVEATSNLIPSPRRARSTDPDLLAGITRTFASTAAYHDETGEFPAGNFDLLHRHGLLGLTVPREFGGAGRGLSEARELVAAVARGEPSTALVLTMSLLLSRSLASDDCRWPRALRERVLRSVVEDGELGNHLRVEPELGSPSRGGLPGTVGRSTAQGWVLSGRKIYSTGIDGLRWLVVWGRTDEAEPRVGTFLVPRDAPGIRVERSWNHLGMRATRSDTVILEEVPLPLDHAVDLRPPAQWNVGLDVEQMAWMSVLLGALYDAVARNARDWLVRFLNERAPGSLGAPLATVPRVQEALGEIELLLQTNQTHLDGATFAAVAGVPWWIPQSSLLKVGVTRNAIEVVDRALRASGNHGLGRDNPLQRHYRDVLCSRVHMPQDDSALTAAGRAALADADR